MNNLAVLDETAGNRVQRLFSNILYLVGQIGLQAGMESMACNGVS